MLFQPFLALRMSGGTCFIGMARFPSSCFCVICTVSFMFHLMSVSRTITKLNRLLEDRHMPAELRCKLRHYFRYKCIFATNMDCMHELLSSMSPGLRQEVSAHTCQVRSISMLSCAGLGIPVWQQSNPHYCRYSSHKWHTSRVVTRRS